MQGGARADISIVFVEKDPIAKPHVSSWLEQRDLTENPTRKRLRGLITEYLLLSE